MKIKNRNKKFDKVNLWNKLIIIEFMEIRLVLEVEELRIS